jgi:hypothetical protein
MRIHKDGYIQCRDALVWLPLKDYHNAQNSGMYRNQNLLKAISDHLGVEIEGEVTSIRAVHWMGGRVRLKINFNWVQPTRA